MIIEHYFIPYKLFTTLCFNTNKKHMYLLLISKYVIQHFNVN